MKLFTKNLFTLLLAFVPFTSLLAQNNDEDSTDQNDRIQQTVNWDSSSLFPNNVNIYPNSGNDSVPPCDFRAILKCTIKNTFNKQYYYSSLTNVAINVSSTVPCNVYFFYISDPEEDSHSKQISTLFSGRYIGNATWTTRYSGYYKILIMPCNGYTSGNCNVTIGGVSFSNAPIYNIFLAYTLGTNHEYNIFTNRSSHDFSLCAFEGTEPGRVVAFNDNYTGTGDHNWGNNARIRKQFNNAISGVAVVAPFSTDPKESIHYTDLYIGCQKDTIISTHFPALKQDDVIRTAPATPNFLADVFYNCISWAGGEWLYWEWPLSPNSQYYDADSLTAFDKYFNAHGFTRSGATEENSAIDLWANNGKYTHASIKNKALPYATGYAWESKAGRNIRFMHPRYALTDNRPSRYGEVVEHYTPINWPYIVTNVIGENSSFSNVEMSIINTMKNSLPSSVISSFNEQYALWVSDTTYTYHSDLSESISSPYFTQLLQICYDNANAIALAYEKLNEGDLMSSVLIEEVNIDQNMDVIQSVWQYNDSLLTNTSIRRSNLANATMYCKGVLAKQMNANMNNMFGNLSYSNDENVFSLKAENGQIDISFSLESPYNVSIFLARADGQYMKTILKERMDSGDHHIRTVAPEKGIYTVHVLLNGRIYSKKLFVN